MYAFLSLYVIGYLDTSVLKHEDNQPVGTEALDVAGGADGCSG